MEFKAWFEEEAKLDEVTIQEFDKYIEEYCVVRDESEEIEKKLAEVNKKLSAMSLKLIEFLEAQGKTSHITRSGKITVVTKTTWKAPEGEERQEVIELLKERGLYDNVMAFNAAKFSSWFSSEKESNPEFDLKGVEQKITKYIRR